MYSPTDNPPFGGYSPDLSVLKQGIDFVLGSSVVVAVMFFTRITLCSFLLVRRTQPPVLEQEKGNSDILKDFFSCLSLAFCLMLLAKSPVCSETHGHPELQQLTALGASSPLSELFCASQGSNLPLKCSILSPKGALPTPNTRRQECCGAHLWKLQLHLQS